MRIILGITGASGIIYALRLIEELKKRGCEIYAIITEYGKKIMEHEMGMDEKELRKKVDVLYHENEMESSLASGSFDPDAMIIVPCSIKTLGSIASGIPSNLLTRAAMCSLKEGKKLILVLRETPLDLISLENMVKAKKAGVIILPAMPAFYHKPKDMDGIINYVVGKILEQMGIEHNLYKKWG